MYDLISKIDQEAYLICESKGDYITLNKLFNFENI